MTRLQTRIDAGVPLAAQGLSLSEDDLAANDAQLRRFLRRAREGAAARLGARFDRLLVSDEETIWQQTSADGRLVTVIDILCLARPNAPLRRVRLRGLDPDAEYRRSDDQASFTGRALMGPGLPLPHASLVTSTEDTFMPPGDFASAVIELERVA